MNGLVSACQVTKSRFNFKLSAACASGSPAWSHVHNHIRTNTHTHTHAPTYPNAFTHLSPSKDTKTLTIVSKQGHAKDNKSNHPNKQTWADDATVYRAAWSCCLIVLPDQWNLVMLQLDSFCEVNIEATISKQKPSISSTSLKWYTS